MIAHSNMSTPCCAGGESFRVTRRTKLTRLPKRGSHARERIYAILDEAPFCTVSYARATADDDDQMVPDVWAVPQLFGRSGDWLYLHGSVSSGLAKRLRARDAGESAATGAAPIRMVVTATLFDGLVLAKSLFHHSANYRSVCIFADEVVAITESKEKMQALRAISEHSLRGRWQDPLVRDPDEPELKSTVVFKIRLDECSAKVRTGLNSDDKRDLDLACWSGVLPFERRWGEPKPDASTVTRAVPLPAYLSKIIQKNSPIGAKHRAVLLLVVAALVAVAAAWLR